MPRHWLALAIPVVIALSFIITFRPMPALARSSNNSPRPVSKVSDVPSPRSVLGFTPGDDRTIADWREIVNYFQLLDRASDRIRTEVIGETTLSRPFIVAFISAPENIRDLAKLKEIQRKLADPRAIRDDAERARLMDEGKTVVAISCSIHSDEIVASQMSMQLAFELVTAEDAVTREILQNTILILIPSANPDGVQIVADWYRKTLGTPYEGSEPPQLYHHYAGHDNNRDWFMLNLRETRLVTRLFWKEWFPQIVYDVHQQGTSASRFFIPPFHDPANPRIAPLLLREVGVLGYKVAADLQAAGFEGVITNAIYDMWWHGGFRTAPYYHNSIGILSEAASANIMTPVNVPRAELAQATARGMRSALQPAINFPAPWPGGLWRPRDIMNMEMTAARSILSMAARYRSEYLRNFYELGRSNSRPPEATNEPVAYLIPAGQGNDESVAKMIDALVMQGVETHRLDRELHISAAHHHEMMEEAPAGSYIIFLAQPYRTNVQALFEPQVYPQRRSASGEVERPYDVTGWTLPMQMGIETISVMKIKEEASEMRLTLIRDGAEVRRSFGLALQQGASSSPVANPLKRPVRLAVYQSWRASTDEGWTRLVMDTHNVPYESLHDRDVRAGRLRATYDVIILPSQSARQIVEGNSRGSYPAEFTGGITEAGVENLRRFVNEGGTLICFDASSELAIKRFNLPLRNVLEGVGSNEFYCPGSILRINLDKTHAITRGMPPSADAYFINSSAFEATDGAAGRVRVVARYAEKDTLRSGWLLGEGRIAGRVALAEVSMGKGRVVLFGFRPQHRGQTWGTFPLIFNSIS
ncbi:MAG: M14 family metallopeptidase [Pyrinomonadaceae bacterium]